MKTIYAGLIGFGNIGAGTVKLLMENGSLIEQRLGAKIVIKKIADLDLKTPRPVTVDRKLLTKDAKAILNDPEISIVIELVGGYEPAKGFILEAIRQGKHVVTANKALLATYGNEIFKAAERRGVNIGFEASVGGTIPVIKTLRESLAANRIRSIFSILNGTTNFILTKMTDEGKNFKTVLREAQALGFAEADPTFDVEGIDTAHKLGIVLALSYGKKVNLEEIYREGITGVSQQDIEFAKELGYKIKLLAIAIERGGAIEARIHPTMIPFDHLLASVNGNYNALHIRGDASGPVFLYGQGSGMMPTASAVVADLIDIARDLLKGISRRVPSRSLSEDRIEDHRADADGRHRDQLLLPFFGPGPARRAVENLRDSREAQHQHFRRHPEGQGPGQGGLGARRHDDPRIPGEGYAGGPEGNRQAGRSERQNGAHPHRGRQTEMKYAVLLGDGMADWAVESLGGKTPLEYAKIPNMDRIAREGTLGLIDTVPKGFKPGSDVAILSVLGYDPEACYTGRGPLEAASMGVHLEPGDLAFRCNLVTLGRRAGPDHGGLYGRAHHYGRGAPDHPRARSVNRLRPPEVLPRRGLPAPARLEGRRAGGGDDPSP